MASVVKKKEQKLPVGHPLARQFDTAEEGAKAKAEYVMNTVLKDFNWPAFIAKKNGEVKE